MRRRQQQAFANPMLLGAVTVLVAIIGRVPRLQRQHGVAVRADAGARVDIPNGAALLPGNQVLAGGYRIGVVSDMRPVRLANGSVEAQVTLASNTATARCRSTRRRRSARGAAGAEVHRASTTGRSSQVIPDGGLLPAARPRCRCSSTTSTRCSTRKTRPAVQHDLVGFGDVLAARGSALNDTFAALPALLLHLGPVAGYLSQPSTELTRFLGALNGFFATVSPVAGVQARLLADQATTFDAISRTASDLENTIRESPPTLDRSRPIRSATAAVPRRPDAPRPTTCDRPRASLRAALPSLDPALQAGVRVLPRTPSMNVKLQGVLAALRSLAIDPGTNIALNGLTQTVGILNPMLKYLGPVRDGVQLLEHDVVRPRRRRVPADDPGERAARAPQLRQPPDQQCRLAGGDRSGQRLSKPRPTRPPNRRAAAPTPSISTARPTRRP